MLTKTEEAAFDDLLSTVAGRVVDNQCEAEAQIPSSGKWSLDVQNASITWTSAGKKKLSSGVQYLGSFSKESNSWLWAWSNKSLEVPPESLEVALAFKEYVQGLGLKSLCKKKIQFSSDGLLGSFGSYTPWDIVYLIAGISNLPAFSCPKDDGELFVLLDNPKFKATKGSLSLEELEARFHKATTMMTFMNQRKALDTYARHHGFKVDDNGDEVHVVKAKVSKVFHFDGNLCGRKFKSVESLNKFFDEFK